MQWSAMLVAAFLVSKIQGKAPLQLAIDFTSIDATGRLRICNFFTCWGIDDPLLMKEASATFRCSVLVKSPETPIADWYLPDHLQLFAVDMSCRGTEKLLREAEIFGLFNGNVVWLVISQQSNGTMEVVEDLYVTVLSQFHVATRVSENRFEVITLYRRYPTDRMIQERLGYWTREKGMVVTGRSRRENTQGRVFKMSAVVTDDDSLNHIDDLVDPQIDNPTKIYYSYWKNMIEAMNGRINLIIARKWGERINGSFDGMIGDVERGEAELAASPALVTDDRSTVLQFLGVGHVLRFKLMFLSPPLSYKNNIYLLSFSSGVWYTCLLFLALSVGLLYAIVGLEDEDDSRRTSRSRRLNKSWMEILMLNVSTICQQDIRVEPSGAGGRIIILHVKILVLFVSVFYSTSILLLLQSSDRSITDLKALDESNFKIGSHDTPFNRFYFKNTTDPMRKLIVAKVPKKNGFLTAEEGIKKVRDGFFAFNINTGTGYMFVRRFFNERERCQLQELEETLLPTGSPHFAVKRNFPYRKIICVMFIRIFERGFVRRESLRKSERKTPCQQNGKSYVNIGLIDSKGAFELLLWAFLVSILICLGEIFLFRWRVRRASRLLLQYGYHE